MRKLEIIGRQMITYYAFVQAVRLSPGGPIPHNLAQTFDGPPTLERSGPEHRRAVTSSRP